jgi:ribonuclease P protein component
MREEDVPTEQPEAQEDARFSDSHANSRWSGAHRPTSPQGTQRAVGLIWRVRDRASFRALAQARRYRCGVLTMTRIAGRDGEPARVAYAVGRRAGNAVVRNTVRRRLRAATRAHATSFAPGHLYLVGAQPSAATASFQQLEDDLVALLERTEGAR